ncbi:MAG: class I SAM-dependent methyltransferase [Terriglobia bacterium]
MERKESGPGVISRAPFRPTPGRRTVPAREGYDLWAKTYDHDPNPLIALEERILRALLPSVEGKHVLDIACGTGRWLEKILRQGARSGMGVDLSSAMLATAAAKPALRGRLVRAECVELPFCSSITDLLVCSFALDHIRELGPFAREMSRVAKQRADIYLTSLHPAAYAKGWQTGFRHLGEAIEIDAFPHTPGEIREAFRPEQFELVRYLEPVFGEQERPIFAKAGRGASFDSACQQPAVLICHLARRALNLQTSYS